MLEQRVCHTTVPAADLERAKAWYSERLGLEPFEENEEGVWYRCGEGSIFSLYPSTFAGTAQHTVMAWEASDLEADMRELRDRGVAFEDYDMPGLKTVDGIADFGPYRGAWLKDSEGNTFLLFETARTDPADR